LRSPPWLDQLLRVQPEGKTMARRLAFSLLVGALVSACSNEMSRPGAAQRACDDGGAGGVVIDGVCL
jgi:hypothetical protein